MSKNTHDWAWWAVVVMTFAAIGGLGWLAGRTLREQAFETAQRDRAETVERLRILSRSFFEDLPAPLRSEPWLIYPSPDQPLQSMPSPESPEELVALATFSGTGSPSRPLLLEAVLNAELERKPFWYLHLLKATLREGDFDSLHRHAARLLDWPTDSAALAGVSMKTLAAFYEAEAFLREGDAGKAVESVRTMACFSRPAGRDFRRILANGPWAHLRSSPLFAVLLWSWEHPDLQVSGPRFIFPLSSSDVTTGRGLPHPGDAVEEHPALFLRPQDGAGRLYQAAPFLRLLLDHLQAAAGANWKVFLASDDDGASDRVALVPGLRFTLVPEGPDKPGPMLPGRLLVGFLLSLGLSGLAAMTLFHLKKRQETIVQEEKEWLFRQAAHDLKTPLTTIRALAETLSLGRVTFPEQGPHYLGKILHECDYSSELIDALLLAARLRTGAVCITPEEIAVFPLLTRLLERFQPRMGNWDISLDVPRGLVIEADPHLFERVVMNLLENAVRHAGAGKALSIDCGFPTAESVALRVGDRGPGLSPEAGSLPDGDDSERPHTRSGSGLGLSLIRRIIDLQQGILRIEARPGGGAVVVTTWKLVQKG